MTPEEYAAEAERIYGRVYDQQVHADALRGAGIDPGGIKDTWEMRYAVQSNMLASANYHANMALVGLLEQMPVCGHGNRGWCQSCFTLAANHGI